MKIHEKLKKYRILAKMTQEELANKIHVTAHAISQYENGTRSIDSTKLPLIANALDMDVAFMQKELNQNEINSGVIVVQFVSVWDDGIEIRTNAKYDFTKHQVYDIESKDVDGLNLEILDEEYILLPGEKKIIVVPKEEKEAFKKEIENETMAYYIQ